VFSDNLANGVEQGDWPVGVRDGVIKLLRLPDGCSDISLSLAGVVLQVKGRSEYWA